MMQEIKFLKIRDVKSPSRAYKYDAGIDFYVPKFTTNFIKSLKEKNPHLWAITTNNKSSVLNDNAHDISQNNKVDKVINFDEDLGKAYFILPPFTSVNIPSGIKSKMSSSERALIAFNKSGIASKYGLLVGAQVVDYEYMGEIHINVINTSSKDVKIYEDMKIIQFIEVPIFNSNINVKEINFSENITEEARKLKIEVETTNFYKDMSSNRKENGFGSTDNK